MSHAQSYLPLRPTRPAQSGLFGSDPVDVYPRFSAGVYYDDNVTLQEEDPISDVVIVLSPGLTILGGETKGAVSSGPSIQGGSGFSFQPGRAAVASQTLVTTSRGFSLDYAPEFNFYAHHSELNSIDHVGRFNAAYPFTRLSLRLQQDVELLSEAVLDVGGRTRSKRYQTLLDAQYELSDLTSFQSTMRYYISDYEDGIGSSTWQGAAGVNHELSPRTSIGLAGSVGRLDVDGSASQLYQQATVRSRYEVTDFISVAASAGMEWRQFDSAEPDTSGFIFDFSGTYAPTERTLVSLTAGRNTQNSAISSGQNYTDTTATLRLRQDIAERVSASIDMSYHNLAYSATETGAEGSRADDYFSFRFGVSFAVAPRLFLEAFYQFRENSSSGSSIAYRNNQVGVSANWSY